MSVIVPAWPSGFGLKRDDYCVEAKALFARFTTPPSRKYKRAIDALIRALKKAGIWTRLDALYVFAAANSQSALLNWIANAYNASLVSSPTFTAGVGYAGNGTSSYVDSNFDPTTAVSPKFVRDDATFGIWSNTSGTQTASAAGLFSTTGVTILPRSAANTTTARINQASAVASAAIVTDGRGLRLAIRAGASSMRVSANGATIVSGSDASAAPPAGSFRFGSISSSSFSSVQIRAGIIAASLTTDQDAALYAALTAYFVTIA